MCQICLNATTRLEEMLPQLQKEFPGTSIDGQPIDVGHHVTVALFAALVARPEGWLLFKAEAEQLLNAAFQEAIQAVDSRPDIVVTEQKRKDMN